MPYTTVAVVGDKIPVAFPNAFGAWTSYTPTVSVGFTTATYTLSGAYVQVQKTVWFRAQVQIATLTTPGTATFAINLPVQAASSLPSQFQAGTAQFRTNAAAYVPGVVSIAASATTFSVLICTPGAGNPNLSRWLGNVPAGQAAGDIWSFSGCYEAA